MGDARRQPRPVILDASARWAITSDSQVIREARERRGLGPWVFVSCSAEVDGERERVVEGVGGKYIRLPTSTPGGSGGNGSGHGRFDWADILSALARLGIKSVMVEGGAEVIHSLLVPPGRGFVDVVVLTIAPVWLGQGGVVVAPPKVQRHPGATGDAEEKEEDGGTAAAALPLKLTDVAWTQMGQDVVLCGRIPK
jgi:2,5-diamino-6-(ribosylamino)-4(3H)-pyrimidinone 5'-phosphate reductase